LASRAKAEVNAEVNAGRVSLKIERLGSLITCLPRLDLKIQKPAHHELASVGPCHGRGLPGSEETEAPDNAELHAAGGPGEQAGRRAGEVIRLADYQPQPPPPRIPCVMYFTKTQHDGAHITPTIALTTAFADANTRENFPEASPKGPDLMHIRVLAGQ
jgi:hypothetical protein